jgi:arylsulfatase A-like enzyme
MRPRLRFLANALLASLCGAALELAWFAAQRPWTSSAFGHAAWQLAAIWAVTSAAFALVVVVARARRGVEPASAWLVPPAVWSVGWLLTELDSRGAIDTPKIAAVGLFGLLVAIGAIGALGRPLAKLGLFGRPSLFVALLLAASGAAVWRWRQVTPRPGAPPTSRHPNVLWISLDTTRADRVGAYGSTSGLTPRLDRLAQEGVLFEDATAPMPLTAPSHTAMLTGLPPHRSGVHKNGVPLPRDTRSLPRDLASDGYATAAFVSGFPLFERSSHLAEHFHHYDDTFDPDEPLCEAVRFSPLGNLTLRALRKHWKWREPIVRSGDLTVDRTLAWLDAQKGDAHPFFVFCHLYDVHGPYTPHRLGGRPPTLKPSKFWGLSTSLERLQCIDSAYERNLLAQLYDGGVAFVDEQVGRLLDGLAARGELDDTLVVVTADHGESLGEHAFWYEHINPYHVETHVPLILRLPHGEHAGQRVKGPVQLQDLDATVRELVGATHDAPDTSSSLAGAIERGVVPRRLLFCQSMFGFDNAWFETSVRDGRFKLLRASTSFQRADSRRVPGGEQLFDLSADPGELHDLIANAPDDARLDELRSALDTFEKACVSVGEDVLDPEVQANLARLGYAHH